jgi:hypothetical protein
MVFRYRAAPGHEPTAEIRLCLPVSRHSRTNRVPVSGRLDARQSFATCNLFIRRDEQFVAKLTFGAAPNFILQHTPGRRLGPPRLARASQCAQLWGERRQGQVVDDGPFGAQVVKSTYLQLDSRKDSNRRGSPCSS